MAMPDTLNLELKRGANFYMEIDCYVGTSTTALDISTYVFDCDIKTIPSGGIIAPINATCSTSVTNKLIMSMGSTVSAVLPTSGENFDQTENYFYDLKVNTGSAIEYWLQGDFKVTPAVTT